MASVERKYDLYSERFRADTYAIFAEMRERDPVLCQPGIDGETPIWFVTRYDDVVAVLLDDERFVRGLVARLTRHHEAAEPRPWKMGDSAPEFIDEMLGKIVGLEIKVTSLTGKAKLSQNKEARDRLDAAETLATRGRGELAEAMRKAS